MRIWSAFLQNKQKNTEERKNRYANQTISEIHPKFENSVKTHTQVTQPDILPPQKTHTQKARHTDTDTYIKTDTHIN